MCDHYLYVVHMHPDVSFDLLRSAKHFRGGSIQGSTNSKYFSSVSKWLGLESLHRCSSEMGPFQWRFYGGLGGAGAPPPNVLSPTPFYDLAIQNFI